jgi:hypothetical protein
MPLIHGPAIVKRGTTFFYFADGLKEAITTKTGQSKSDLHGTVEDFHISRKAVISGKLTGMIRSLADLFPYSVADIGGSIFGNVAVPLEIYSRSGTRIAYARSALTKSPTLNLSATGDIWDDAIEFTCLNKAGELATVADTWKSISSVALPAGDFDETKIRRYRYTAAYGAAPFNAMTAQAGFKISAMCATEEIPDDNFGIGDIALTDLTASCRFTPSNLTETQIDTLLKLQGTGALLPGEAVAKGNVDLVISGSDASGGFTATLSRAGFTNAELSYAAGKLRAGEVAAVARRTFTGGAANTLWTFAAS